MSLKSHGLEPIPEETRRLVERLCPKGTTVTQLRDALGPIYSDEHFAHLFPKRGRAAEAPWRLALVTVLQAIEGLTDRQAAEAVRTLSSLESVGEGMRAALNALAEQDPDWLSAHLNPEWFDRYVHRFELARFPKAETERTLLREQVGQDVAQLLAALDQPQTPQAVRAMAEVALLRQLFAQHYEQRGQQIHWRDGPAVSNEDRIVSPYDPEARASRKRDTVWLGYKVHLTETCDQDPGCPHLITQVETTPATWQDSEMLAPIQEHLRTKELAPAEHYVDQAYPSGPELVRQASLGTQIIGPVGQDTSWQAREQTGYAVGDFALDWHAQVATCPQGHQSVGWTHPPDRRQHPTVVIRFAEATCRSCPVRAQCTRGHEGRTLTLMPLEVHAALHERRAVQRSPAFVQQYALRAGIEGTIAQAVRTTRLRRTPYAGLRKTHLHHLAIAAGLNLRRIVAHLHAQSLGKPTRPVRAKSPFARLQHQEVT